MRKGANLSNIMDEITHEFGIYKHGNNAAKQDNMPVSETKKERKNGNKNVQE